MKPVNYVHESGIGFTTERLVSFDERSSHDISVVCLWMPNNASEPMRIIDYYCGEPDFDATKRTADEWIAKQPRAFLSQIPALQDIDWLDRVKVTEE